MTSGKDDAELRAHRQRESNETALDEAAKLDRVDEMSESSFPASDPPAAWTWDPGLRNEKRIR